MNQDQFRELIDIIKTISLSLGDRHYTLTGASDWPILASMIGVLAAILVSIWLDFRGQFRDLRAVVMSFATKEDLQREERERKEGDDHIWASIRECKEECHGSLRERPR